MNRSLQGRSVQPIPFRPYKPDREVARPHRILRRGEHLYRTGDTVEQVYTVLAGAMKSYAIHADGEEQVLGFHFPGDLVGFDAPVDRPATCNVLALDTVSLQSLWSARKTRYTDRSVHTLLTGMHRQLLRLNQLLHLERASADARVAAFLLDYADSQAARGCTREHLRLPMKRRDLAQYLGLAPETLSRVLGRLRDADQLRVSGQQITLRDPEGLEQIANGRGLGH